MRTAGSEPRRKVMEEGREIVCRCGAPSKLYLGCVQEIVTLAGSKGGALAN